MGRNFLAHAQGDAINPVLAAMGYNFRLILKWIQALCLKILATILSLRRTGNLQITA